jgi:hypothetical protein
VLARRKPQSTSKINEADLHSSDTNKILGQQIKANIQLAEQGTNLKKVLEMTLAEKHGDYCK